MKQYSTDLLFGMCYFFLKYTTNNTCIGWTNELITRISDNLLIQGRI